MLILNQCFCTEILAQARQVQRVIIITQEDTDSLSLSLSLSSIVGNFNVEGVVVVKYK